MSQRIDFSQCFGENCLSAAITRSFPQLKEPRSIAGARREEERGKNEREESEQAEEVNRT
jgi:hypothetical protein